MRLFKLTMSACAAFGLVASMTAQALTYDTHSYRNSDGSSKFQDPDESLQDDSDKASGFSMKFSGGSSDHSSSSNDQLFLPQSGRAAPLSGGSGFDTALGNDHRW